MNKYILTARMTARGKTIGGILFLLPDILVRSLCLIPLLMLWRSLYSPSDGDALANVLTYSFMAALLYELLSIRTPLTNWYYDGSAVSLYQRPMSVFGHVIAQALGATVPGLLLFSVPAALLSPLFGVSLMPRSLWAIPSFFLSVSLGFAVEFLFSCLFIRMVNVTWVVFVIRHALMGLFTGAVIPFSVMPFGIGQVLSFLPLGSLGGAFLSVYSGLADPGPILLTQLLWNLILWPLAVFGFRKSQERMVSFGG